MTGTWITFVVGELVTVLVAVVASSGFWAFLQRRDTRKSATVELLRGLAHDRIVYLGLGYIDRGWITKDEYEDLMHYLYDPYSSVGGNGLAERIINEVGKLPIRSKDLAKTRLSEEGPEWKLTMPRIRELPEQS